MLRPKATMNCINIGLAVVQADGLPMIPKPNSSLTSNDPCFPDQMDDLTPEKRTENLSPIEPYADAMVIQMLRCCLFSLAPMRAQIMVYSVVGALVPIHANAC